MNKILIFSITYFPFVGGAEVALKEITSRLNNFEFDIITLRLNKSLPKYEKIGNLNIYRVGFAGSKSNPEEYSNFFLKINKYLYPTLAYLKASSLNRKNKYCLIWAIMANYAGLAGLFFKMRHKKISYLLTLQEGDPIPLIKKKVKFFYPLFVRIFTKADMIQPISNHLKDFAVDMGYFGPIEVIPNGVDISLFSKKYNEQELDVLRRELGKRMAGEVNCNEPGVNEKLKNDVFLVTTSRLVEKNRVEDVIMSLFHLPKNVKFLILGTGEKLSYLKSMVSEFDLDCRVFFLGLVEQSEIPKYLKISDIFVRPSSSEGFGNSFIEAMAAGLPVIATQVGGIKDFVFDPFINLDKEPTGLFCEVKNPESIADRVDLLIGDKDIRQRIIKNSEKMVREKYDWNLITSDMNKKIFSKLCKKR